MEKYQSTNRKRIEEVQLIFNQGIAARPSMWRTVRLWTLCTINIYIYIYIVSALKSVPLEIIGWFFPPFPANFSASYKPGLEFPSVPASLEKTKNLNLIKIAKSKKKKQGKKKMPHELFCLWLLKSQTDANRLRIKFCTRKSNSLFSIKWMWYVEK